MQFMLRQVDPTEVETVHEILKSCGQDMRMRLGLGHWDPPYPLELLRADAEKRKVYAVSAEEQVIATFTIGTQAPSYYHTISGLREMWDPLGEPALYVNRLAVLPEAQGKGIGVWCMQEIEQIASHEGCNSVRLDAYYKHLKLVSWYTYLGYANRGTFTVHTTLYGETGMTCLEKRL